MTTQKKTEGRLGKQNLVCSQVLETGDMPSYIGPQENNTRGSEGRRQKGDESIRPEPLLGFLQERQTRTG